MMPSTSGSSLRISSPKRWGRQPRTTPASSLPFVFNRHSSRIVSIDSAFAASMKPQVFTTATSAPAAESTPRQPPAARPPSATSESTSVRAQPRLVRWILKGGLAKDLQAFAREEHLPHDALAGGTQLKTIERQLHVGGIAGPDLDLILGGPALLLTALEDGPAIPPTC